ncbi:MULTISPECIES: conserved virulence factor C family protein [unclassified Peribacillus]|uniref:conserved virulence factor C family protein n=1 Tax=unclassified Peribacillus TaxID=2675266 RepID=UPI001913746A|nr:MULTISPECIES: conserved virulence factor C family protein [unclassified Peribacillus]MBK5463056.1 conserved virulence factor C family protein [Peribacillus sp. TH27]WMX53765.1 conserved virulence factor C family protein [Peribacillus sp. R9-11]
MKIKSIEPTPSPNTMKINLTEELLAGKSNNYKKNQADQAPQLIKDLFTIEGVKGVYHVADFLAVERNAKYDWKDILVQIRQVFGEKTEEQNQQTVINEHYGEVTVAIQQFKGIPMQIKASDSQHEKRFALPEYFIKGIAAAQKEDDNVVLLRKWKDYGIRYGDMDNIVKEVADELVAAFPEERINQLVAAAQETVDKKEAFVKRPKIKLTAEMLNDENWEKRYQALEQMEDPTVEEIPVLDIALSDSKVSIRRLAVVYLGMIEDTKVLPSLYKALKDSSVAVRRTAGDCLSDLGFEEAMGEMSQSLSDKNKLVRWRAAMFLYEVGNETVLPYLKQAEQDPEFEVALQVKMAIDRIENGEEAKGSVWKQMTESRQTNDK